MRSTNLSSPTSGQVSPSREARHPQSARDCRCPCGSLLARRVEGGIEIKCRGCKSLVLVAMTQDTRVGQTLRLEPVDDSRRRRAG